MPAVDVPRLAGDQGWSLAVSVLEKLANGSATAPLVVLWGHPGVGKSTLIRDLLIGQEGKPNGGGVVHESADDFARGYAFSRRHELAGRLDQWRSVRLQSPLWIVEDLHQLAGRTAAQQELCRLLDSRACCLMPSLVSSSFWPLSADKFRPALLDRLAGALLIELPPPGAASRCRWIETYLASRGFAITTTAALHLSHAFPASLAPLRQALGELLQTTHGRPKITAGSVLDDVAIDDVAVQQLVAARRRAWQPPLKRIATAVSKEFSIPLTQLRSASRQQSVVVARGAAFFLARTLTERSLADLGKYFGGRDHATVLHALRTTTDRRQADPDFARALARLERSLEQTH